MALSSALSIGNTGLLSQQAVIDVIGNNISNLTTTAYKGFRAELANLFYINPSIGNAAGANSAGTNPIQFGQGVRVGSVIANFDQGPILTTNIATDLYINGTGFFNVDNNGTTLYTRNGSFRTDSQGFITTSQGYNLQGYGVDADFNVDTSTVVDLQVQVGQTQFAQATTAITLQGTLNSSGAVATRSTILQSDATSATSLNDLIANITVGGTPLLDDGSGGFNSPVQLTYTPAKETGNLEPATIQLDPTTSTLNDLMNFVQAALEINTSVTQPDTAGFQLLAGGILQITGNMGTVNNFSIDASDFAVQRLSDGNPGTLSLAFPTVVQEANGESAAASFTVYDSAGNAITVDSVVYLQATGTTGTAWQVLYASPDQVTGGALNRIVSTDTLNFNTQGVFTSDTNPTLSIQRVGTGAVTPLQFSSDYTSVFALATPQSNFALGNQDGIATGTLDSFVFDSNGFIIGSFTNSQTQILGQVILSRFNNPQGLIAQSEGYYIVGPNSGAAIDDTPGNTVGTILGGALEGSNVQLTSSLIELVTASTAFQANSQTITTAQTIFDTLLQLPR